MTPENSPQPPKPASTKAPGFYVSQLHKHYNGVPILSQVDLTVAPGEFVAIVGDSGVGKSTLLNCMAGLDTWNQGHITQVTAGGAQIEIAPMSDTQRALWRRAHVGFVFQAFHVLPHLDVEQNIALPLMLLGQTDAARVRYLLDAVGLSGLGSRLPQQLSGGQLQRVAIARALVHQPPLVLADEPTGNLDPTTASRIMQLLRQQTREHGASLVMVTHSDAAAAQADRVVRLTTQGMQESTPLNTPIDDKSAGVDHFAGNNTHLSHS